MPGAPGSHGASSHTAARGEGAVLRHTPSPNFLPRPQFLQKPSATPLPLPIRGGRFGRVSCLGRRGLSPIVVPSESGTRIRFVCLCLRACDRNPSPPGFPGGFAKGRSRPLIFLFRCRPHSCVALPVPGARGALSRGFPGHVCSVGCSLASPMCFFIPKLNGNFLEFLLKVSVFAQHFKSFLTKSNFLSWSCLWVVIFLYPHMSVYWFAQGEIFPQIDRKPQKHFAYSGNERMKLLSILFSWRLIDDTRIMHIEMECGGVASWSLKLCLPG